MRLFTICVVRRPSPVLAVVLCLIVALTGDNGSFAADPKVADSTFGVLLGNGEKPLTESETSKTPCFDADRFASPNPFGVEVRGDHVWMTTVGDNRIWETTVSSSSTVLNQKICHIAGNGQQGYSGDGGPATDATFNWPHEVRADQQGNLFIADTRNHVIRRIEHGSGIITTLAGNGESGFAGDGDSGVAVRFSQPHSIVLDGVGGLLVADTINHRLRRIDLQTGIVETVSGNGKKELPTDGANAATSPLFGPRSLAVDDSYIWIALREGNSIWRIDRKANTIHHIAGSGKKGYSGDGGSLTEATFSGPKGIVLSGDKRLAIVDTENHAIRVIDTAAKSISTVLGGNFAEKTLSMKRPHGIAFHPRLGWLVADSEHDRIVFLRNE